MKLRYEFTVMDMDGEIVAVPVEEDAEKFHGVLKLNPVAADILEQLKEETDPVKVHWYLKGKYPEATDDEIGKTLAAFLSKLYREGILEDKELDNRLRQAQKG